MEVANELYNLNVSKENLKDSLKNVFVPGRYQMISKKPIFIIDVAHNPHSIKTLVKNFSTSHPNQKIDIILGMLKEKKPIDCIKILERIANKIYLTDVPNPRSFNSKLITAKSKNDKILYIKNNEIPKIIKEQKGLIIAGSIYLIGSIISKGYVKIKLN